jgi:hypothetical protein
LALKQEEKVNSCDKPYWDEINLKHDLSRLGERESILNWLYPGLSYEKYREVLFDFGIFQRRPELIPNCILHKKFVYIDGMDRNKNLDNIYDRLVFCGYDPDIAYDVDQIRRFGMTDEARDLMRQIDENAEQILAELHEMAKKGRYFSGWTEEGKKALLDYKPTKKLSFRERWIIFWKTSLKKERRSPSGGGCRNESAPSPALTRPIVSTAAPGSHRLLSFPPPS